MSDPHEQAERILDGVLVEPASAVTIPREQIPHLLLLVGTRQGQLAAAQAALAARLIAELPTAAAGTAPEADRLLTVEEAALLLCVDPRWIKRRAGQLPYVRRLGRQLRVSQSALRSYLAKKSSAARQ